ncbi:MAG: flagellar assembly protein FliW [Deltaproteobacteria bacterium]|jgi:flagellar assembly factor FliW|nr:flagellar assembly protein FliW [Deltaproteobacteria bacterium]
MTTNPTPSTNLNGTEPKVIKIATVRFGDMEFQEESVITVLGGIIGFPTLIRYVLIQRPSDAPFYWLQSLDDPTMALVLVNPVLFKNDYNPPLPNIIQEELKAEAPTDITLFAIVTIPAGRPQDMTANLLGPLVINPNSRLARQLVLDDSLYSHRQPIIPASE